MLEERRIPGLGLPRQHEQMKARLRSSCPTGGRPCRTLRERPQPITHSRAHLALVMPGHCGVTFGHRITCGRRRASPPDASLRQHPRRATRAKTATTAASPNVDQASRGRSRSCPLRKQATRPSMGSPYGAAQRPLSPPGACGPAAVATAAPGVMHTDPLLASGSGQCGDAARAASEAVAPCCAVLSRPGFGRTERPAGHGLSKGSGPPEMRQKPSSKQ